MPSFDIVSEVDKQEVRNAVDQVNKEVGTRFDFKGSDARVNRQITRSRFLPMMNSNQDRCWTFSWRSCKARCRRALSGERAIGKDKR